MIDLKWKISGRLGAERPYIGFQPSMVTGCPALRCAGLLGTRVMYLGKQQVGIQIFVDRRRDHHFPDQLMWERFAHMNESETDLGRSTVSNLFNFGIANAVSRCWQIGTTQEIDKNTQGEQGNDLCLEKRQEKGCWHPLEDCLKSFLIPNDAWAKTPETNSLGPYRSCLSDQRMRKPGHFFSRMEKVLKGEKRHRHFCSQNWARKRTPMPWHPGERNRCSYPLSESEMAKKTADFWKRLLASRRYSKTHQQSLAY